MVCRYVINSYLCFILFYPFNLAHCLPPRNKLYIFSWFSYPRWSHLLSLWLYVELCVYKAWIVFIAVSIAGVWSGAFGLSNPLVLITQFTVWVPAVNLFSVWKWKIVFILSREELLSQNNKGQKGRKMLIKQCNLIWLSTTLSLSGKISRLDRVQAHLLLCLTVLYNLSSISSDRWDDLLYCFPCYTASHQN